MFGVRVFIVGKHLPEQLNIQITMPKKANTLVKRPFLLIKVLIEGPLSNNLMTNNLLRSLCEDSEMNILGLNVI